MLLLLTACKPDPVEAPPTFDELMKALWVDYAAGGDADLGETLEGLSAFPEEGSGLLGDLDAAQIGLVEMAHEPDPAAAAGIYLVNAFACDLDTLEGVLVSLDQLTLYPGAYDSYERRYTSDFDAYMAREAGELTWEVSIASSPLGNDYTQEISGGLRRAETGLGTAIFARTWLVEPAEFENPDRSFTQDYQIEAFYEASPDSILHFYGIWRQIDFGPGLTSDDEGLQNLTLSNLEKWDEQTEALCAGEGG